MAMWLCQGMKTIVLTMAEVKRVEVIQRVFRGEVTMVEAAMVLGVTERHSYRIKARIRKEGVQGVVHGNRGRICKRKLSEKTKRRIVEPARGKYRGFNDHHLSEKLVEVEGIKACREKIRQILKGQGDLVFLQATPQQTSKPKGEKSGRGNDAPGRWVSPRLAGGKGAPALSSGGH